MGSSDKTISYTIDIGADITKARQAAEQLQATFRKSFGESSNKSMFNLFSGLEKALDTLERKGSQKITSIADAKALEKAKKDVIDYFDAIEREGRKIGNLGGVDFKKRLEGLGTQLADSAKAWKTFEDAQKSANKESEKQSSDIQKKIDDNKKLIQSMRELKAAQDALGGKGGEVAVAKGRATRLETAYNSAKGVASNKTRIANQAQKNYEDYIKQHNVSLTESGAVSTSIKSKAKMGYITDADLAVINQYLATVRKLDKEIAKLEKTKGYDQKVVDQKKAERDAAKTNFDNAIKLRGLSLTATGDIDKASIQQNRQAVEDQISEAQRLGQAWKDAAKDQQEAQKKMAEAQAQAKQARTEADTKEATFKANADQYKAYNDQLAKNREAIRQSREELRKFVDEASSSRFDQLKEALRGIFGDEFVADMENSEEGLEKLKEKLNTIGDEKINEARTRIKEFLDALKESGPAGNAVKELGDKVDKAGQDVQQLTDRQEEVESFISRFKQFFTLTNGFMLLKRSVKDAINTIKELDAVMTQTAVVSTKTVGEMWKTLPQYSAEAKKLGSSIADVYKAQTLYVQQGLNMNDAMDLGVETLKMARVAGIDAAEATNSMTAALRGFNMELNETSATRINDVYSKLAQNTASNVQEISTAMTKTAALANSANMSFENTAAFLATIIESTREGAETAGTALKTVIARFTEVKKLYSEGELSGTDEEGQEVDVNKISKALRTAGINMNDFFTGAKGLDEIFMELGSKWSSLTTVQQRYIATMAAGSRQQSRFLALMQNYSRTVELTQMAYNSAGSGQEQFEKTLDSLEAKLNKLKAAWQTFIMGIANSDVVKGLIDTGTKILETINRIIDAISGGNGLVKSIASIAAAVGVFKAGKGLAGLLIGGTNGRGGLLGPIVGKLFGDKQAGETAAKGFLGSFTSTIKTGDTSAVKKAFTDFYNKNINWKNQINPYEQFGNHRAQDNIRNSFLDDVENSPLKEGEKLKLQYTYDSEGLKSATDLAKKMGVTLDKTDKSMKAFKTNLNAIGNSCLMVGGALLALTSYLQSTGKIGDKTAKILKGISAAFIAFGGVLKLTQVAISIFSKSATASISSIPIIGWIAAAIAALIALSSAIADVAWETNAEKAERLKNEFETLKETTENLKNEYNDLQKKLGELKQQETGFDKLIEGTIEYDTALQNLNQSILSLIQLYPDLAEAVEYVNGKFVLNDKEYQKYLDKKKKELQDAQDMENIAELTSAYSERDSYGFWKGLWDGIKGAFLGWDNYEGNVKGYQGKVGTAVGDDLGRFNNVLNGFQMLLSPWKIFTADMYDRNGLYTDELNYLSKKIMEGTLIFDKDDDEKNKKSIETLLEFYKKDTSSTRDYGSDSSSVKEIYKVLKDHYSYLEDYGEKNKIIQQSKEKLKSNAIINTYENTLVSKTKYSDIFYKMASIVYDKVQISDEERAIKQKQKTRSDVAVELGYKKASDISEENYKLWIDYAIIQEKLTKDLNSYYSSFLRLEPEQKDLFSRLVNYEGLKGLTITEVDNYTSETLQKDIDSLAEALNLTPEEINKLIGVTNLEEALEGLGDSIYVSINNLSNKDTLESLIKSSKFQTIEEATTLAEKTAYIQSHGGNGQQFLTKINDLLKDADSNKLEEAKNIILNTDWYSKEDIRSAMSDLENLGIEIDNNFTNQIIQATKAVSKFSITNFEEQLKRLESSRATAEKIESGERKISAQEYADITQEAAVYYGQGAWENDWIRTGIDEWTYIGDETNSLLDSIDGAVKAIAEDKLKERKQAYEAGLNVKNSLINQDGTNKKVYRGMNDQGIDAFEFFESLFDKEKTANPSDTAIYNAASIAGISIEGLTRQEQIDALKNWYEDYGIGGANLEANEQAYLAAQGYSTGLYNQTAKEQFLLDQAQTGDEEAAKLLQGKVTAANLDYAVEQMQESAKVKPEDIEKTKNAYNALALAVQKDVKQIDNLNSVLNDNWQNFKDSEKGTESYTKAITNLIPALKKVFGEQVNEKWIEHYKDQIDALSKGGKEAEYAFEQIRIDQSVEAFNKLNKITGLTSDQLAIIQSEWKNLDGSNLDIGGTFDASKILSSLQLTKQQATDLATYISGLAGMTAEYDVIGKDEHDLPIYGLKIHKTGASGSGLSKPSGGGGGGGGKKDFKNDFDKYYNMVEDINELQRLRNLLETDYEQLLKSETISGKAIYDNLKKQIQLLKERRDITADLAEKRKGQIFETMDDKQYASVRKYAWWNDTDQTIEIDWNAINKVKDSEQGDLIKEYVSKLEGFQSQYDEQIEALEDIESTLQEIQKRGQEEYTSLEDRTRDALIKQIQDKIDELTAVDEAINDTNQKLMDSIQKELEKQRQERENAKTEEELADKEQRLAYLQQDSSGANALEIAKLQEELADARESYTDSLIDQKIAELQEQNDEAAQQRQEQIDLMQQSLDWQEKSGAFWEQVYEYIQAGTDEVGTLVHGSELENLLKAGEAWDSLSEEGQMKWLEELENQVAQAIGYLSLSRQLEEIGTKEGTKITFTDAEGNTHTGTADKNGNVVVKNADGSTTTWKDVYQSYDGSYRTLETQEDATTKQKPATNTGSNSSNNNKDKEPRKEPKKDPETTKTYALGKVSADSVWVYPFEYAFGTYTKEEAEAKARARNKDTETKLRNKLLEAKKRYDLFISNFNNSKRMPINYYEEQELLKDIEKYEALLAQGQFQRKGYKTGGLADYTGPAWLDGTPSKPELVLNARDTENFIQLKDHLAALRQAGTFNTGGDNYYDIDVHVESLGSDYDVDMAIDRIKTRLYQDGAYRNVNTLNRLR